MVYDNSSDPVDELLLLMRQGARITTSPAEMTTLFSIGLTYYTIVVTCNDGTEYPIQAYGEEATKLYNKVGEMKENPTIMTIPVKLSDR